MKHNFLLSTHILILYTKTKKSSLNTANFSQSFLRIYWGKEIDMTKAYSYAVEVKVLVAKTGEVILGNCRHATAPESGWAEEIAGDNSWATALKMLDLHSGYCSELKEEDGYVRIWSSPSVQP